jgi:hypothetical protein
VTAPEPTRYGVERTIDACLRARSERRKRSYTLARPEALIAPLEAWLADELGGPVRIDALVRAPGGASKENFFFSLEQGGERRALLLRLDPGESIDETHRLREFQVLRAVEGAAPVPHVLAVDADAKRLERPSLVMERVGRPQPEVGGRTSGVGIAFEPELRGPWPTTSSPRWWGSTRSTGARASSPRSTSRARARAKPPAGGLAGGSARTPRTPSRSSR